MIQVGRPDADQERLKAIQNPQGESRGRCVCRHPSPDQTLHTKDMTESNEYLIDDLIENHPQKDRIKKIKRLAHRSKSGLHKDVLGALAILSGPFAGGAFGLRDAQIEKDLHKCIDTFDQFVTLLEHTEPNRIIMIHL